MTTRTCVFIVGPTAAGKTAVAIRLAEELGTGIISADSRQIYREMRIGTAVPSDAELRKVRHYLLQHHSVEEYYNASMFENEAMEVLDELFRQGDYALVCGGSGLYVKALGEGIDDIPKVDPSIRKDLLGKLDREGLESLRSELEKLDPVSFEKIDLRNPKRILKALEISLTSGRPYSSFLTAAGKTRDFKSLKLGIRLEREELYNRINDRVDLMMAGGFLEEVESCLPYRHLNALNTVGYKELFEYLDGMHSLEEAIRLIKRNTRHYARRQLTWFRRDPEISWFGPDQTEEMLGFIRHSGQIADGS